MARSSLTLCWVGLVFSSWAAAIEHALLFAQLVAHLPDGLEERQRLDIPHGSADLGDHHVSVMRDPPDGGLDLVGDVRDHLDGLAQVIAAPLARDDLFVDAPGSQIVHLGEARVGEALVMSQVEVGFGAVVGDEHLAVLEGAERARVHVEVGVELLQGNAQSAALEQAADRSRRDAFSERGDHAAGDEAVLSHALRKQPKAQTSGPPFRGPPAYPRQSTRIRFRPPGCGGRSRAHGAARVARPFRAAPRAAPDS